MSAVKYKKLCTKCKKYYTPYNSPISRQGVCRDCRISKSKCGAINELGYQCQNEIEFFGYCKEHFLKKPLKELKKEAAKLA
ncbi:hypothetical protein J4413_02305 [Candidatus Woesearchaeota archaeon]|nr:hypothetical protein [Candidatus Woesearchaeota archaeon]